MHCPFFVRLTKCERSCLHAPCHNGEHHVYRQCRERREGVGKVALWLNGERRTVCLSMAKVEKRFEKYKPLQKKNLRILKLVVCRQKQGDFLGKPLELFFETHGFEQHRDRVGGRITPCAGRHVRDHTLAHYAHTAGSRFLCSPFTLFFNLLIYKMIQVKKEPFFCFTG